MSTSHHVIVSSYHRVIVSSWNRIIVSSCQFARLWALKFVSFSACESWSMWACFDRKTFWVPFVSVCGPLWFLFCSKLCLFWKFGDLFKWDTLVSYPCYKSEIRKFFSMKFISGSDFNNTRISCQENLDLWIVLFASGELLSLSCTHSLILRSRFHRDQKPRKKLFQIIQTFWNGSLINMQ